MKHLSTEERHNLWKKEHDLAEKLIRMRRELRQGHHDQMQEKRDRAREDQVRKYIVVDKYSQNRLELFKVLIRVPYVSSALYSESPF